ncbi:FG-GAP repeat domain-containing protein [Tautonia marina]|uniref:FG-GAP repeat domain-containing protein n=1 Tax=Tautonia marina TaxID=2653855 RepID=UPI001260EAFD|nr:VCBS repeat-containing protein [Tautonia marina]
MPLLTLPLAWLLAIGLVIDDPHVASVFELDGDGWVRHTIDDSSSGADGVRLADLNGDGLLDLATGWEEGGIVRAYLNPGPDRAKAPWPAVTVGQVASPEDAVIVDLDGDGFPDIVSSCEGKTQTVFVHWNPGDPAALLDPEAWTTEPIPATVGMQQWMWCVPMQVDGRFGVDLVVAGKNDGASLGWLEAPENPRNLSAWRWHPIRPVGWIMSLLAHDLDFDGDLDLIGSDRRGDRRGVFWLERRGPAHSTEWVEHPIGGEDAEVMFLDVADLNGREDILVATRDRGVQIFRTEEDSWQSSRIPLGDAIGTGKAVAVGELNGDGWLHLVVSTENARGKHGLVQITWIGKTIDGPVRLRTISGAQEGTKFDLVRLIDLDGDGDLDVLTCEETDGLGVIWYENPGPDLERR